MIAVKELSFTYVGTDNPAVRGLDFAIERGEIFGFLGPSGSGKTTTQKILNGLLKGYEGQVTVLGREVSDWQADYYEKIGVSFELPNHYQKLTGLENLACFSALYGGKIEEPAHLLERVGLEEDGNMLVSQYSKGMKNRLSVARAILHNPELVFMDEPTAGLDPVNARRIKDLIRQQRDNGCTVFLTTHDMHVADELCDRVGFILDGELQLIDSPRRLKLQHGRQQVQVEYGGNGRIEMAEFALQGLAGNGRFLDILSHDNIQTIHSQEATLEDIFVEVTGRGLS